MWVGARDSILSLDCFKAIGVFHRSQCYCGEWSVECGVWKVITRSIQMNYVISKKLIYIFFLEECTIVQEGHTVLG